MPKGRVGSYKEASVQTKAAIKKTFIKTIESKAKIVF